MAGVQQRSLSLTCGPLLHAFPRSFSPVSSLLHYPIKEKNWLGLSPWHQERPSLEPLNGPAFLWANHQEEGLFDAM